MSQMNSSKKILAVRENTQISKQVQILLKNIYVFAIVENKRGKFSYVADGTFELMSDKLKDAVLLGAHKNSVSLDLLYFLWFKQLT